LRDCILRWNDHVQMILVKANRLQCNARHTAEEVWQKLTNCGFDSRIQNLPAVLANPHYVILEMVCTVS
jgi:hypothetical protein